MAKKNNKKNKEIVEKSKFETYYNYIIIALAVIAIIIVLVILIPKSNKSNEYTQDYEYLEYDNVYTMITVDELKEKINNKETFHVVLCNNNLDGADYFMYYVDEIASEKKINEVYYVKTIDIKGANKTYLTIELGLGNDVLQQPNILYFANGVPEVQTFTTDIEEYRNCWERVLAYFTSVDAYLEETE